MSQVKPTRYVCPRCEEEKRDGKEPTGLSAEEARDEMDKRRGIKRKRAREEGDDSDEEDVEKLVEPDEEDDADEDDEHVWKDFGQESDEGDDHAQGRTEQRIPEGMEEDGYDNRRVPHVYQSARTEEQSMRGYRGDKGPEVGWHRKGLQESEHHPTEADATKSRAKSNSGRRLAERQPRGLEGRGKPREREANNLHDGVKRRSGKLLSQHYERVERGNDEAAGTVEDNEGSDVGEMFLWPNEEDGFVGPRDAPPWFDEESDRLLWNASPFNGDGVGVCGAPDGRTREQSAQAIPRPEQVSRQVQCGPGLGVPPPLDPLSGAHHHCLCSLQITHTVFIVIPSVAQALLKSTKWVLVSMRRVLARRGIALCNVTPGLLRWTMERPLSLRRRG